MTKQDIRSEYLSLRLALTADQVKSANQNLFNQFFQNIDLSSVRVLHTFLPIDSKKEPDTWPIIKKLKLNFPNIRISVPKVENNHLVNFYFENEEQLRKNKWGIPEPSSGEITPVEKIDLVLVPLLAFDKQGTRVGYGKGFYDQFLKECRPDCRKVGLSFFEPTTQFIPKDIHDVSLDAVITSSGIINCD